MYRIMLNPRQVIGWKPKIGSGRVQFTALPIKEVGGEDVDGFGEQF